MRQPWVPWAEKNPGHDSHRPLDPRAVVWHRPQGTCPGVVRVGQTRLHSTPGTFNFTLCHDGVLHQHYPFDARCSHAAGGNYAGPGVEVEDYDGTLITDAQIDTIARLVAWADAEWGIPRTYYNAEQGRIWLDRHAYRGHVSHEAIDYPPNRSYLHYDDVPTFQFAEALRRAGGGFLAAPPINLEDDMGGRLIINDGHPHVFTIIAKDTVRERWSYAGQPKWGDHKLPNSDKYPLKVGGEVSTGRSDKAPGDYAVALERADTPDTTRLMAYVGGEWIYE